MKVKLINDSIANSSVLLVLESDSASFHVYDRVVKGNLLHFEISGNDLFVDINTHSTWNMDGICIAGMLKGEHLGIVQSYQEFWHSWKTFHPDTGSDNVAISSDVLNASPGH